MVTSDYASFSAEQTYAIEGEVEDVPGPLLSHVVHALGIDCPFLETCLAEFEAVGNVLQQDKIEDRVLVSGGTEVNVGVASVVLREEWNL